jgi:hypothetical protein
MRHEWALATCGFIGMLGLVVMTAEKPPDEYSQAMKNIGAAAQSANTAIQAQDFDMVSKNAASIIEAFPVVEKYWNGKAADAVQLVHTASKAASDMRVAAGLQSSEGVAYAAKELNGTCMQCHTAHRETLPDGSFQIK